MSYDLLAEIKVTKDSLYDDKSYNEYIFSMYLTELMKKESMIPAAKMLLEDENFEEDFYIDSEILQNLILYMYKYIFKRNSSYVSN